MSSFSRRQFLRRSALATAGLAGGSRRASGLWLPQPAAGAIYRTVTPAESHITWKHDNAKSLMHWLPESMCSGCAIFDYDNDGWMDIFLVNTGRCDFFQPKVPPHNALYKNNRDGTFTDVTREAGLLGGETWGEGAAVGDYDGDGLPDLYVTGYGRNLLYHNNGDGTFTDVTGKAGVGDSGWSTSAAWFDYDNDGRLDLFVCSFVEYSDQLKISCGDNKLGKRYYCIPRLFNPRPSKLYRNNGDGTFTEVGHLAGIGQNPGKSHGVVATDINNDGWMDLFVSNDTAANFLFVNHKGRFEENGFMAGVAYSEEGTPRSGMGLDSADYDNDDWMDLYVANIDHERFSLYHNNHDGTFTDMAAQSGIGADSYLRSGWGVRFLDYDNDGELDLFQADAHPDDMVQSYDEGVHWYEKPMLFHGNGRGLFALVPPAAAGSAFSRRWSARGMAIGDWDNDGGIDVLINNNGARPLLLHNQVGRLNRWLGVFLVGRKCNRDAVGAKVSWHFGELTRTREKTAGGSYLSSHDPRLVLGCGQAARIDWLEVRWPQPSGAVERIPNPPMNRYITIVEGEGIRPYPYKIKR